MNNKKIQDIIFSYMILYKKGLNTQDVLDNSYIFASLSEELQKKNKDICDLNLEFTSNDKVIFYIKSSTQNDEKNFQIEVTDINYDLLSNLLFGQISCSDYLIKSSKFKIDIKNIEFGKLFSEASNSWERFLERVGYKEEDFFTSDESNYARKQINEDNILWCYNKSCTGKTFLGLYTLTYCNYQKYVYNPSVSNTCDINLIKILLEYGTDFGLLIDDLQCDVESGKVILSFLCKYQTSIQNRNIHIFITSWSSLFQSEEFSIYSKDLNIIKTKPEKFINMMKDKINDQNLLNICGDNLALISTALRLKRENLNSVEISINELFDCFVKTADEDQLKIIHILAVLGTYEFETPLLFIRNFGTLYWQNITTAKRIGDSIFLAHRTISNFIARYIETEKNCSLYQRKEIIKKYINYIDNRKKWKALVHLIGENKGTDTMSCSPIWNLMYEFQDNLSRQTKLDPSWDNTPSSMYFVISTAKMLGVVDEYKDVVNELCSNFEICNNQLIINYERLQTTNDFIMIKERMIEEDKYNATSKYEKGEEINLKIIHRNWLYGLIIGVKSVLVDNGYKELIRHIEDELINVQDEAGYWYPKRVPWVTARILIGLAEAGYSIKDNFIKKGVNYLIEAIDDDKWDAHTGGWNNEFETSSLCLEALIKCGMDCDKEVIKKVTNFLLNNSSVWMSENYEIDGTTTSCVLLKILGIQDSLLHYINILANRNIHNIVDMTEKLDYNNVQSCKTTQIAYYLIELCWYILEKDISNLLDDFIARSEQEMDVVKMNKIKIFISYSEDSKNHIKKISRIVDHLEKEGYIVFFYEYAPLGTNNMEFMQKITQCDLTIVIGTKKYKEKSMEIKSGGVFFESCVLSREFINNNYEKIIPIAFDDFNDSFPEPLSINKGIRVKRVNDNFLNNLTLELKNKIRR